MICIVNSWLIYRDVINGLLEKLLCRLQITTAFFFSVVHVTEHIDA